jgi:deoxyribodipyrimidine photolyase-related protein
LLFVVVTAMKSIALVFPHQLFKIHPAVAASDEVWLVEEFLFFRQYRFHQQKLVFHRASMQFYQNHLQQSGKKTHYINAIDPLSDIRLLIPFLDEQGISTIHYTDTCDNWLEKRIHQAAAAQGIRLIRSDSPGFLNTPEHASTFFEGRKKYFQTDFYIDQRKKRNLLLDAGGQPAGGKWTYDTENRERFPKNEPIPRYPFPKENKWVKAARSYVAAHFSHHYGENSRPFPATDEKSFYPVTFEESEEWLDQFLQTRFAKFGTYEDAIVAKESILYHSVLTPMLNTGLLEPQQVLDRTMAVAKKTAIPLNATEGFLRQILGWREFIRIVYHREGSRQRTKNYWGFTRKIPRSFWTGETGIPPIDITIKKILQSGYCHHIERLMVLGNFMLLCEFDPDEVYQWFMEMFIDAYDWVMVPNVYGMTQFADGGLMTTKPYISGSNYLIKMGDYPKGEWQPVWDGLFWRFMHVHRNFFEQNPRLGMLLKTFDKMPAEKRNHHLTTAENFLQTLDKNYAEETLEPR